MSEIATMELAHRGSASLTMIRPRGRLVLKDGNSLLQAYEPAMRDMTIFTLGHVC